MAEELEPLLVRLLGDSSEYTRMLRTAQASTESAAGRIESAAGQIEGFTGSLKGFASNAVAALSSLGTLNVMKQAVDNFAEAELIGLKLNAALEANGREVDATMARYTAFALEMERLTTVEDDAVLKMLQLAESMGLTGDAAERAVKNAIALAAAKGGEAESYVRVTAALEEGRVVARAINPALANIKDNTERVAAAQQMLGKMFGTARAEAGSYSGKLKILGRDYGNLLEDFGGTVARFVTPIISVFTGLVAWVRNLSKEVKDAIVYLSGLVVIITGFVPVMAILAPLLKTAFGPLLLVRGALAGIFGPIFALLSPVVLIKAALATVSFLFVGLLPLVFSLLNPLNLVLGLLTAAKFALVLYFGPFFSILKWVVSIGAALAAWIHEVGGIGNALQQVVDIGKSLWEWIAPIKDALVSLFQTIFQVGSQAFLRLGEAMLDWLRQMVALVNVDWNQVRTVIVGVIKFLELIILHLGEITTAVMGGIKSVVTSLAADVRAFLGPAIESVKELFASLGPAADQGAGSVRTLSDTLGTIGGMVGAAVAIAGIILAVKTLSAVLGVLQIKMALVKIQQVAMIVLTAAWNSVVAASGAVVALFNIQLAIWKFLLIGGTAATGGWTIMTLAAKAATWLWNAALTVTNIQLAAITALAVGGTIAVLATVFAVVGAAIYAAYQAGRALFIVLGEIPVNAGPLAAIGALFGEWFTIIKDVARVASTDMALAWELLSAGFELAVLQVKALWPPLWEFIKGGFALAGQIIAEEFERSFSQAITNISIRAGEVAGAFGMAGQAMLLALQAVNQQVAKDREESIDRAKKKMGELVGAFKLPEASDEIKALQEKIAGLREKVAEALEPAGGAAAAALQGIAAVAEGVGEEAGKNFGQAYNDKARKELQKFDAAAFGSAEALARITAFREGLLGKGKGKNKDDIRKEQEQRVALEEAQRRIGMDANLAGAKVAETALEVLRQNAIFGGAGEVVAGALQQDPFAWLREAQVQLAALMGAGAAGAGAFGPANPMDWLREAAVQTAVLAGAGAAGRSAIGVQEQGNFILSEIRDLMRESLKRPTLEIKPANLA